MLTLKQRKVCAIKNEKYAKPPSKNVKNMLYLDKSHKVNKAKKQKGVI